MSAHDNTPPRPNEAGQPIRRIHVTAILAAMLVGASATLITDMITLGKG